MSACDRIRTVLDRLAEGETSPDESLVAAHHLADCTVCRIRLARARRLAEVLEHHMTDPVAVDDEFVEAVMRALPETPPRKHGRRTLRLVRLGVLAALALLPIRYAGLVDALALVDGHGRFGAGTSSAASAGFAGVGLDRDTLTPVIGLIAAGLPEFSRMTWIRALLPVVALVLLATGFVLLGGWLAHRALQRFSDA